MALNMFRIAANITALALVMTLIIPLSLLAQPGDASGRVRERASQANCVDGQGTPAHIANDPQANNIICQ
jgi:hypothetical protein